MKQTQNRSGGKRISFLRTVWKKLVSPDGFFSDVNAERKPSVLDLKRRSKARKTR